MIKKERKRENSFRFKQTLECACVSESRVSGGKPDASSFPNGSRSTAIETHEHTQKRDLRVIHLLPVF